MRPYIKCFNLLTSENKPSVNFDAKTLSEIRRTIGTYKAETGGFITCKTNHFLVDMFDFDEEAHTTSTSYSHTQNWATEVCNRNRMQGYITAGIIHSHPAGYVTPSFADIANCLQFIRFFKRDWLYVPIVIPKADGNFALYFYTAILLKDTVVVKQLYTLKAEATEFYYNNTDLYEKEYSIAELDAYYGMEQGYYKPQPFEPKPYTPERSEFEKNVQNSAIQEKLEQHYAQLMDQVFVEVAPEEVPVEAIEETEVPEDFCAEEPDAAVYQASPEDAKANPQLTDEFRRQLFKRVEGVYPDKVLNKVVICVGVGGARHLLEDLARNGFNNFVLIDGDRVEPQNVATQGISLSDIGKPKVEAARDSIMNINPFAKVVCVDRFLNDSFTDEEFLEFVKMFPGKKPTDYLIYGCCDSFSGNRRAVGLALNYGIPYIGAGLYEGGYLGEIIFTYPGVTPSCPRCMTEFRYAADESPEGITPAVSQGSINFVTTRLNATLGFIGLMLLMYHDAPNSVYNDMLDHVRNRNFVWIRMNPFVAQSSLGIDFFEQKLNGSTAGGYVFMDETLWLPQHPNHPKYGERRCPLCGGEGDLRILIRKWRDTRHA